MENLKFARRAAKPRAILIPPARTRRTPNPAYRVAETITRRIAPEKE
jgi:hypothetical protein